MIAVICIVRLVRVGRVAIQISPRTPWKAIMRLGESFANIEQASLKPGVTSALPGPCIASQS